MAEGWFDDPEDYVDIDDMKSQLDWAYETIAELKLDIKQLTEENDKLVAILQKLIKASNDVLADCYGVRAR